MKNEIKVRLNLNEISLKRFKTSRLIKEILKANQINELILGENHLKVNISQYDYLRDIASNDSENIKFSKI